jgi:hypothetical protein
MRSGGVGRHRTFGEGCCTTYALTCSRGAGFLLASRLFGIVERFGDHCHALDIRRVAFRAARREVETGDDVGIRTKAAFIGGLTEADAFRPAAGAFGQGVILPFAGSCGGDAFVETLVGYGLLDARSYWEVAASVLVFQSERGSGLRRRTRLALGRDGLPLVADTG